MFTNFLYKLFFICLFVSRYLGRIPNQSTLLFRVLTMTIDLLYFFSFTEMRTLLALLALTVASVYANYNRKKSSCLLLYYVYIVLANLHMAGNLASGCVCVRSVLVAVCVFIYSLHVHPPSPCQGH